MVRRLDEPATAGIHRVTWDLRSQGIALAPSVPLGGGGAAAAVDAAARWRRRGGGAAAVAVAAAEAAVAGGGGGEIDPELLAAFGGGRGGGGGAFVLPGKYTVALAKRVNGVVTDLPGSRDHRSGGRHALLRRKSASPWWSSRTSSSKLQKALTATQDAATEAGTRLDSIKRAIDATPSLSPKFHEQALSLQRDLDAINLALSGDRIWRSHNEGVPASISERIQSAGSSTRGTSHPTKTAMEQYQIGSDELAVEIPKLQEADRYRHQESREAARCRRRAAHSGPTAGLEGRQVKEGGDVRQHSPSQPRREASFAHRRSP